MKRTRLHAFLAARQLSHVDLAASSGLSLRGVYYVVAGKTEPSRATMARILHGCRKLTRRRDIAITELFDFTVSEKSKAAA